MKRTLACLMLALPLAAFAAHEFKGVEFEETARQANGNVLPLKGLTEVDHNYLPLYAAGLYTGQKHPDARQLSQGQVPCRIEMRWLINALTPELANVYWDQEFARSLGDKAVAEQLKPSIRRFAGLSHGAARAESMTIDYDPELGLAVSRNGAAAVHFPGVQFSRALLGIWLGPQAPQSRRNELLGGVETVTAAPQ
jgi:hypothetical protein